MPFLPDVVLSTYRRMEQLAPMLWTRYGLGNALNLDREYACPHTIALDQGLVLIMMENMRTGLVWRLMSAHPITQRALHAAGFVPGSLKEPLVPAVRPGNPGAVLSIPFMDHAVAIDGDLHEWIRREAIELTPAQRRNVETGFIRDARDASALAYVGWTHEMLYLAGILTDDEWVTTARGSQIYRDDCLEVFVDLDGDGFRFDRNPHDVQIGLAPGGPDGTWQVWAWGALNRFPQEVHAALKRQAGRVLFELGIPLELLPGFAAGRSVRLSVAYHDRDTDGKTGKLHWSVDTESVPGTILFGRVSLEPPSPEPQ